MEKKYIEDNLNHLFQSWSYRACAMGALVFLALSILDSFWSPENSATFFQYRIAIAAFLLFIARLIKKTANTALHKILWYMALIASAVTIELMILQSDGHQSPYYVGFMILGVYSASFFPARILIHVCGVLTIFLIYLLPITLNETIADKSFFIGANIILISLFITVLVGRYISTISLVKELKLKFELKQHQQKLEQGVKERTRELLQAVEGMRKEAELRKKAEKQLLQAQKMEAIGTLAGGIAHDFSNILTTILGYSELILKEVSTNVPLAEKIRHIKNSGEKAATLTRQILAFSRRQILEMKQVNVNTIVENMTKMLTRLINENIRLEVKTRAEPGNVLADAGQIEQILINLVVNARDAMPCGGHLTIETSAVELDEDFVKQNQGAKKGRYVMIAVTDTGEGISDEIQQKIFEPFFSTKEADKGTGLGLSTVYGIVKQHHGYITVDSKLRSETTFKVFLPEWQGQLHESNLRGLTSPPPHGDETLLVAEDDPTTRRLIHDLLQPLGYKLLMAANGEEALKMGNLYEGDIDLLLTDVIMPDMNGNELAETLKAVRPSLKVMFMSGYTDDIIAHHGVLKSGINLIQKPFNSDKIANEIRKLLDK